MNDTKSSFLAVIVLFVFAGFTFTMGNYFSTNVPNMDPLMFLWFPLTFFLIGTSIVILFKELIKVIKTV